MSKKFDSKTILIIFLTAVLIFISTNSYVKAQIGGENQVDSGVINGDGIVDGGPGFIMVNPRSFQPETKECEWSLAGGLYNPDTTNPTYLNAALFLPHKATITKVTLYYKDDHPNNNILLILYRGTGTADLQKMAELAPDSDAFAYQYFSISDIAYEEVDNQSYSYFLFVAFPRSDALNGAIELANVRIDYEYTSNLPAVMR